MHVACRCATCEQFWSEKTYYVLCWAWAVQEFYGVPFALSGVAEQLSGVGGPATAAATNNCGTNAPANNAGTTTNVEVASDTVATTNYCGTNYCGTNYCGTNNGSADIDVPCCFNRSCNVFSERVSERSARDRSNNQV